MYRVANRSRLTETTWLELDPSTNPPASVRPKLRLDPENRTLAVVSTLSIDGTPMDEWHGLVLAFRVDSPHGTPDAAALADEIEAGKYDHLLDRIVAGHTVRWDGSNNVGVFSDDAQETLLEFQFELNHAPYTEMGFWDAADYYPGIGSDLDVADAYEFDADTSDAALASIAAAAEADAEEGDAAIVHGTEEYFKQVREELRTQREVLA